MPETTGESPIRPPARKPFSFPIRLFYINDNYDQHRAYAAHRAKPWRDRKNIIFWRGGSGGPKLANARSERAFDLDWQQRLALMRMPLAKAPMPPCWTWRCPIAAPFKSPICAPAIEQMGFLGTPVPKVQFLDYRYLVDVDGWTNAWSLLDKLIGGATILKVQSAFGYRQWYYDQLTPWENYIPLASRSFRSR